MVLEFAQAHDENMWRGRCRILEVPAIARSRIAKEVSSLPLSLGGLGLRSAIRTRVSAYWASWADTLPMVQNEHPHIADVMVYHLEGVTQSPCLAAASSAAAELDELDDWEMPQWSALAAGLRPLPREPEHHEPGSSRQGWQHEAAVCVERRFLASHNVPQNGRTGEGHGQVTSRTQCWLGPFDMPFFSVDANRATSVSGPAPAPPLPSPSPV